MYLNPALAGISYGPRATINYRNQWATLGDGFNGGYTTYAAGFDMHIDQLRGGIGLQFVGDQIANGILASYQTALMYSFQIKFSKKVALKIGLEGDYIYRRIKWDELRFSDMINPYTGFYNNVSIPNSTNEVSPKLFSHRFDMGLGFVLFTEKLYFGAALKHFIGSRDNFADLIQSTTPLSITVHLGLNLPIKSAPRYNVFVSPNVLFINQASNFQTEANLIGGVSIVYFGMGYRNVIKNSDAVIFMFGFRRGKFRLGYSYDYTISKLVGRTGGTHELSFTFNWSGADDNSLNPRKNKNFIECPDILKF